MRFQTRAVLAGHSPDPLSDAVTFPIYQTSTYSQSEPNVNKGYCYSRTGNPTRRALEEALAELEKGKFGLAFASGLAAINNTLNILKSGDHVIAGKDLYGGAYRIFTKLYEKFGVSFSFVDITKSELVANAIKPDTRLIWIESPSNPLLSIADIGKIADIAHKKGILVVVDNTFATPYLQRPLTLGADIVLHSTTKYLGGHSDVIGGGIVVDNPDLHEQLKFFQNAVGAVPGPQDCFLVVRGIKTLGLRMERHCQNALAVAEFLKNHPLVKSVYYPGLIEHPGHFIAKNQMENGFGGIVSFEIDGGEACARAFASSTRIFLLAESLGSVRSLLCHPPTMTHASVPREVRIANGISDSLIRLSIGIEDAEDLIADLKRGLESAERVGKTREAVRHG